MVENKLKKEKDQPTAVKSKKDKYIFAVGRRKSATAKVKLYPSGQGLISINERNLTDYFGTLKHQETVLRPLEAVGMEKKVDVKAQAKGGGISGQAEALRLGISRALVVLEPENKTSLKKFGLLTRDARIKERKKPGLKRARRAPQWQKR